MSTEPYPNDDDLHELAVAHTALTANGVQPGKDGYDMGALAAATYAHGWSYKIDRTSVGFQAEIRQSSDIGKQFHTVGIGWSEHAAMTFALRKAVVQYAVRETPS